MIDLARRTENKYERRNLDPSEERSKAAAAQLTTTKHLLASNSVDDTHMDYIRAVFRKRRWQHTLVAALQQAFPHLIPLHFTISMYLEACTLCLYGVNIMLHPAFPYAAMVAFAWRRAADIVGLISII